MAFSSPHLKIAWRSISRKKIHSLINLSGLVCSMAFVLLIAAYVWQAHQVNSELRHADRQYILKSEYRQPGIGMDLTTVGALPKALKEQYPHLVANYYRLDGLTGIVSNDQHVFEENISLGDPSLLKMYGFEASSGDVHTALSSPTSMVVDERAAIKYFGQTDVVGRRLSIRNFAGENRDFEITAVLKKATQNSVMEFMPSMQTSIFLPLSSEAYFGRQVDSWSNLWVVGFLELQAGVRPEQLQQPIKQLLRQHAEEPVADNLTAKLHPLATYYLDDNNGAVRQLILILSLTAAFLIIMASINFINLSVSQSLSRLKEVGVRKILGSSRSQLIAQLLTEYCLLVAIAGLMALLAYPLLAPLFSSIMMKELPPLRALPLAFFAMYLLGVIVLGLLAGIYPALKLSGNRLTDGLKGRIQDLGGKHIIRRSLLCVQFAVAIVVLTASVVVSRQVNTFINGNLGYNKDYLLTAQVPRDWSEKGLNNIELIRQELAKLPQVQDISLSYGIPGAFGDGVQTISKPGASTGTDALLITSDPHFASTYQIPVLAGKFFGEQADGAIASKLVINRKAATALGYDSPEKAIGQQISLFSGDFTGTIAGVTEDFYANSMHSASPSIVWFPVNVYNRYRFLSIRLRGASVASALAALEEQWKKRMPEAPFQYKFMDETIQKMYATEVQLKRASQTATLLSILIVVLGVVGLTSLSMNLRLKEVGIRTVLGANLRHIILLFGKEFYLVFLLALLFAVPLSYFLMDRWLMDYAVKTTLHPLIFALPIVGLSIALLLFISGIVLRAVRTNPVNNLRDE